jgi:eukaryotic translation initiation factor 2C
MIDKVVEMVEERIKEWRDNNQTKFPMTIVYYRDGVSDGQYAQVKEQELSKLREAFKNLAPIGKTFDLVAIVAAKRHHTRFYPEDRKDMDSNKPDKENCKPGTIVDRVVTSLFFTDFYL